MKEICLSGFLQHEMASVGVKLGTVKGVLTL